MRTTTIGRTLLVDIVPVRTTISATTGTTYALIQGIDTDSVCHWLINRIQRSIQ